MLANRTSSCGCCGPGYGIQSQRCSLRGCPGAGTYDNLCSLPNSLSDSQPYSHRYAYTDPYPSAYPSAYSHADADADADPYPSADAHADTHTHPYARLQRTIPKLGVAILR